MSELFDDEDKMLLNEEDLSDLDNLTVESKKNTDADARRRLEDFLDERRLREELLDVIEY